MKPLRVRGEGYRIFPAFDVSFDDGVYAVIGHVAGGGGIDSNGAGKTSVIMAIEFALFGPESRSWTPYVRRGDDRLEVELTFSHRADTYRARRGYLTRGGGKATLDLERSSDGEWEPLTLGKIAETQEMLEELLGFDRDTLRQTAELAQHDRSLAELDPARRKDVFAKGLRADEPWAAVLELVKRDRRAARTQLDQIAGRLAAADERFADRAPLEASIAAAEAMERDATRDLAAAEQERGGADARLQELETAEAQLRHREAARTAAQRVLDARLQTQRQADEARPLAEQERHAIAEIQAVDVAALERQAETVRARITERDREIARHDARVREAQAARAQKQRLEQQWRGLYAQAEALSLSGSQLAHQDDEDEPTCDRCGQHLGAEARARAIASYQQDAAAKHAEAKTFAAQARAVAIPDVADAPPAPDTAALGELQTLEAQLRAAHQDEAECARREARLDALQQTIAAADAPEYLTAVGEARSNLEQAERQLAAVPAVDEEQLLHARGHVRDLAIQVDQQRERLQAAREALVRDRALLAELEHLEQRSKTDRETREQLLADLDDLELLERGCDRDGVRAWWMNEHVIPRLTQEANAILVKLGSPFDLDINADSRVVITRDGYELDYKTMLSGGERTRVDVVLQLAFMELLRARLGVEIGMLLIDERPYLDRAGEEALAETVSVMRDRFPVSFIVAHSDGLNDSPHVDRQILVRKNEDGISEVIAA